MHRFARVPNHSFSDSPLAFMSKLNPPKAIRFHSMLSAIFSIVLILPASGSLNSIEGHATQQAPKICVDLPWQRNRCTSKLVYAQSNAPKDIKNEIERLGAIVDATHDYRIASWNQHKKCYAGLKIVPPKCILKMPDFKGLELKEVSAWKNLYFFAKQYPDYVQPRQLSKVLSWGQAILKCEPNCKFKYD